MENEKIEKEHLLETCKHVLFTLENIVEKIDVEGSTNYWLMTLLCDIGELELCLNYNSELKRSKGKIVQLKPNRLCTCYEDLKCGDQCW